MQRHRHRAPGLAVAGLLAFVACSPVRRDGERPLEPRYVAVHNALAALGLAQVGPIHEGTLGEAREARVSLPLPAGCVTVVALGGDGVRDLDATLVDPHGAPLAHDTTTEPQAVLRVCLDAADTYVAVVKVASGAGSWVLATWVGGASASAGAAAGSSRPGAPEARGTCEGPIPLTVGTVSGSTAHGDYENTGSCGPSDSRELVYELEVRQRERVSLAVEAKFDTVLYLRKDSCADAAAEIDCNDDAPDRTHSRIERVLEPGKYYVFVDGYGHEMGAFKLTVTAEAVLALADVCRRAPLLVAGTAQSGTTEGAANDAEASCGGGAPAAEAAWQMDLPARGRVRLVEHSDDMAPVVHVRHACADERSEMACGDSGEAPGDAAVTGIFDAGKYAVFADAREAGSTGTYSLRLETAPPGGVGVASDGCADAAPLGAGAAGKVSGDTFGARDDVAGSCGGAGAADVVYRMDVARRSHFGASLEGEEGSHVLVLWRRCGDRAAELACGRVVDEVLAPGAYFIAADGATPDALGRFTLKWSLGDLTGQAAACASAAPLVEGRAVDSTTVAQGDKFAPSCASSDAAASGADRVFKLPLAARRTVRVTVNAPGFEAAVALRKACGDLPGVPSGELACEAGSDGNRRVVLEKTLDAGVYWVVVDGQSPTDQGPFTIDYRTR
jgi:hypothetical protein